MAHQDGVPSMFDLIFLGLGLGGFAAMAAYAALTAKL